jgi:folate-binding protein YgfZ
MAASEVRLEHWGCLRISGADSASFLQGQMTLDLLKLPQGQLGFTAFLSPKGRVIANARVLKLEDAVWLILPLTMTQILLQRLKLFVLRSKVVIEDLSEDKIVLGLTDPSLALTNETPASLEDAWPYAAWRWITIRERANCGHIKVDYEAESLWVQRDIESGLAWVLPVSREAHIPQMLNLDLHEGIGFQKGCYTGQEIVARTHYLGQLKRRLFKVECQSDELPEPGTLLYAAEDAGGESVGEWVNAIKKPDSVIEGLAVLKIDQAESPLQSGPERSPVLRVHAFHDVQ